MTWTLVHESDLLTTPVTNSSPQSQPHIAFWYYFFETFLPTRGWSVQVDGPYSVNQNYFLVNKTTTDGYGNSVIWKMLIEMEWGTQDVIMNHCPLDNDTVDKTGKIGCLSNSAFAGLLKTDTHLQIWQSDAAGGFLIKTRDTSAYGIISYQPPDSHWMLYQDSKVDGVNNFMYWFGEGTSAQLKCFNISQDTKSNSNYTRSYLLPTSGSYGGGLTRWTTNKITFGANASLSSFGTHVNAISNEMLAGFWTGGVLDPGQNYRAVQINGKYYIEAYNDTCSLFFDTGSVNPDLGLS